MSSGSGGQSDMPLPGVSKAITSRSAAIAASRYSYSTEEDGFWCSSISVGLSALPDAGAPRR